MVATKLSEIAGMGWDWYSGVPPEGSSSAPHQPPRPPPPPLADSTSSSSSYWNTAQGTISQAAEHSYNTVAGVVSSVYSRSDPTNSGDDSSPPVLEDGPMTTTTPRKLTTTTSSLLLSPALLNIFHNPSIIVRGGRINAEVYPPSSINAVRSLLRVVPASEVTIGGNGEDEIASSSHENQIEENAEHEKPTAWAAVSSWLDSSTNSSGPSSRPPQSHQRPQQYPFASSRSETASQLAEGTLRALRDIALDEAVELHSALRYWSHRWERPLLSWLEAGPTVWLSQDGYQHHLVGQKVSQIQAVLARRCATIGDLQQHLLRAGWQRGVAQWGVLGDGGEWAAVAGFDGRMPTDDYTLTARPPSPFTRVASSALYDEEEEADNDDSPPPPQHELPTKTVPGSNASPSIKQRSRPNSQLYYTNVSVKNNHGGEIVTDDPALAEWSVDAMAIVRRQLYRAANGLVVLPYSTNWSEGDDDPSLTYYEDVNVAGSASVAVTLDYSETAATGESLAPPTLPLWAKAAHIASVEEEEDDDDDEHDEPSHVRQRVTISDFPLMVAEVSELLDVMESIMGLQRARRLEKLKPPAWLRQNWYISAIAIPSVSYMFYKITTKGYGWVFLKYTAQKFMDFFREHVVGPFLAMYDEFTKGIENVSDREARNIAIENLQKMIKSWLDETHPNMPVEERARRAKAMDISLIEVKKEENMKTIYELNSVIRMSFIEAQFIKKEMMNALLALDEMRASTNFNMNIAAVTPFVLLVYTAKQAFKFVFYATLKMGKSAEETYGSFLHILIEIERLLVMRDNPPTLTIRRKGDSKQNAVETGSHLGGSGGGDSVLNADDLGMLMLHIHELRTILWRDRRRFSRDVIRSVAEDLAELAGERGAVSVRQQLQIIGRMCRTYPFLKVVSSQMIFEYVQR